MEGVSPSLLQLATVQIFNDDVPGGYSTTFLFPRQTLHMHYAGRLFCIQLVHLSHASDRLWVVGSGVWELVLKVDRVVSRIGNN